MATQVEPISINPALISLDKYSKLSIAINVAANVIKFCAKKEYLQVKGGRKDGDVQTLKNVQKCI